MTHYFKLIILLFISITLLISCDNSPIDASSVAEFDPDLSEVDSINTISWQGFQRMTFQCETSHGRPVKFNLYTPNKLTAKTPLLIALHGSTSNKESWEELTKWSYTKGGTLTKMALQNGYSLIALDLSHHGEHYLNVEKWNWENSDKYDSVYINHWPYFHEETMLSIESVINFSKSCGLFDTTRTGFVCYSLGGYFINQAAQFHGSTKGLIYLAASTGYNQDEAPEYGPIKNQTGLENANAYIVASKNDQLIPLEKSQWLFDNLNMQNKKFVTYTGDPQYEEGHSLPKDYIEPLKEWLKENL